MNSNRNSGNRRLVVLSKNLEREKRSAVPPHLAEVNWLSHERAAALSAYKDLRAEVKGLTKKVSASRVHKTRVTLRRWLSIWKVLRRDGWETEQYKQQIGKPLKRLQKLLGELRDHDVNIEIAERLGASQKLLKRWSKDRNKLESKLEKSVRRLDLGKIMQRLGEYLRKRPPKIVDALPGAKVQQSAFDHVEFYLLEQESIVREEADTARTPEELHQLRLGIKRWRYLLTEFFGVTNLELVRAQQILGQMHDLDRLTPLLLEQKNEGDALDSLKKRRKELFAEIEVMRQRLPYGLRPEIATFEPAIPAGFGR
jgi:CHAD domain-containing protein